jgi:hypothetical protein
VVGLYRGCGAPGDAGAATGRASPGLRLLCCSLRSPACRGLGGPSGSSWGESVPEVLALRCVEGDVEGTDTDREPARGGRPTVRAVRRCPRLLAAVRLRDSRSARLWL